MRALIVGTIVLLVSIHGLSAALAQTPGSPAPPDVPPAATPAKEQLPPAPAPAAAQPPTCMKYCDVVTKNCTAGRSRYSSIDGCVKRCNAEGWLHGEAGDEAQDTLSCRMSWAAMAASDPGRACMNAGPNSPMCLVGRSLPDVPPLDPAAKTVLGLYDVNDGKDWGGGKRSARVVLGERVSKTLQDRGLTLVHHDASQGLPDRDAVAKSVAIVTSFHDEALPNAVDYILWLWGQMLAGRKVVILNDFGAWRDSTTKVWVPEDLANQVFEELGVRYLADWTDKGSVLKRGEADLSVFRGGKAPSPERAKHYYRFEKVAPDVKVLLVVRRTDRKDNGSVVVFASPRGGMALTRYYEDMNGREFLDLGRFLDLIIKR